MTDLAFETNNLGDIGKDEQLDLPPLKESENPIQEPGELELYRQTRSRRLFWMVLVAMSYFIISVFAYYTEGVLWTAPAFFTSNQWASFWGYTCLLFLLGLGVTWGVSLYFVSWIKILPDNKKYYLKDASGNGKEVGPGLIRVITFYEYAFKEVKISSMTLYVRSTATTSLDGIALIANVRTTYIVEDLQKAIFNISPFMETVRTAIESKLNNVLSQNNYVDIQTKRDDFEKEIIEEIQVEADNEEKPYGIKFTNIEISDIWPATVQARNMLILKLFALLEAEGFKITKEALATAFSDRTPDTIDRLFNTYLLQRGGAKPLVGVDSFSK